ncbi:MAG: GGDEF domain-containing protein [Sulfurospirillaceae bacterium]|nr:GGDEF domain-containing protein [Sulfurospirillaceae bacterium]
MFNTLKFNEWIQSSRIIQIRYIATLTAFLYYIYSEIDVIIVPENSLPLAHFIHLYIIVPILLIIAVLTFFKKYHSIMIYILIFAPAVAAIGNLIILPKLSNINLYLPEIYLCIFWIFTVSGLKLFHAMISATIVIIISSFAILYLSEKEFLMHMFWIFSAASFGSLGAYLLEESSKRIFMNKETLAKLAMTDKLTGLYNRTKFDEVLSNEISRSQRFNHTFGLAIIDVDHFKSVNDDFGHNIGDSFLVEIANLIQEDIRSTDILVRWGGEEFALICLETDLSGILTLAEEIRSKVEAHTFKKVGKKSVSIGVTIYQKDDTNSMIVARADEALYNAKNDGRNCIKVA